jgi:hypothetical protein
MANLHIIQVDYHTEITNGHRVKVSILDLGMYINGFRVYEPNAEHKDWMVFPPQHHAGPRWVNIVEFNKSEPLWVEIYKKCIECVGEDLRYKSLDKDNVLDDEKKRKNNKSISTSSNIASRSYYESD